MNEAFTTILIWLGSGFAFAAGVFFGAFLMSMVMKKRDPSDYEKQSLAAMLRRNEIDECKVNVLERLADNMQQRY